MQLAGVLQRRTGRTARSGRSAGRARRRRESSASACRRRRTYTSLEVSPLRSSWSSGSTARVSSGAKPYSSKVRPDAGRGRTARSCAAAGSHSGKPEMGVGLLIDRLPASVRRPRPGALTSCRRYGLVARSRPMVVAGPWPGSTTVSSASGRILSRRLASIARHAAARQVGAPDRAGEEHVAGEADLRPPPTSCPRPGSRNSTDPPVWPGAWSTVISRPARVSVGAVGQLGDVVRLGVRQPAAEQLGQVHATGPWPGRRASPGRPGARTR